MFLAKYKTEQAASENTETNCLNLKFNCEYSDDPSDL